MTPYYQDELVTLYHGDCREILPQLDVKADLCLTDPPYGIGIANNPFRGKFVKDSWDDVPVSNEALLLVMEFSLEQIIWGGNYFDLPPTQCFLIWDKGQPENFSSAMCEYAWSSFQSPAKKFFLKANQHEKFHPTQKPLALMKWCIENYSEEGQLILDPFAGSCTTGVASKILKRRCILIEQSEKYCEIGAKRLNKPIPLFDKPEQLTL